MLWNGEMGVSVKTSSTWDGEHGDLGAGCGVEKGEETAR